MCRWATEVCIIMRFERSQMLVNLISQGCNYRRPMCTLRGVSNRIGLYGEAHSHVPVVSPCVAATRFEPSLQWRRIEELHYSLACRVVPLPSRCTPQLQWYTQARPYCTEVACDSLWRATQIHTRCLMRCGSQAIFAERPMLHLGPIADCQ